MVTYGNQIFFFLSKKIKRLSKHLQSEEIKSVIRGRYGVFGGYSGMIF